MEIIKGKQNKPQKIVIYGPEGVGKSTFASQFPGALFIDTEDSTVTMDVSRLPKPTSWTMLISEIDYVKKNPQICKSLVVDTADWAERLCVEHICAASKVKGIEDFGYGKGYVYLEEEFGRFLNKLQELIDIGINVVVTAHADIKKIEQPEEIGGFDHWQMKLEKKTMPLLKEWADILLFANYKVYVVNVDNQGAQKGKNKAQGGNRVMYTTHTPWWDAKNRHELPDEIPFEFAAVSHCIPGATNTYQQSEKAAERPITNTTPPSVPQEPALAVNPPTPTTQTTPPTDNSLKIAELKAAGVPKSLIDLMIEFDVTLDEVYKVVTLRGHFPKDTPFKNYPKDYVDGVLIAAWPQVYRVILEQVRENLPF